MKLSDTTLTVLKNFAAINSGVVLQPGKKQKTISSDRSVLVEAVIPDEIPTQFGIYELNTFLGNVTTVKDADLDFGENSVRISGQGLSRGVTYYGSSPNLIISPPVGKDLVLKSVDVSFDLTNQLLSVLLRLAAMNKLPFLSIIGKNGELIIRMYDITNDTSNLVEEKLGDYAGADFNATFKTENIKVIPDDYHVEIQANAFAKFSNKDKSLIYFFGMEKV